jgi:hypothetical protein
MDMEIDQIREKIHTEKIETAISHRFPSSQ